MHARAILVRGDIDIDLLLIALPMATFATPGIRINSRRSCSAYLTSSGLLEFISGNGEEEAEHVAEIVIHKGATTPWN